MVSNKEARAMGYVDRIHYKHYAHMGAEEYKHMKAGGDRTEVKVDYANGVTIVVIFNKNGKPFEIKVTRPSDMVITDEVVNQLVKEIIDDYNSNKC